jgi:hypothetical protein
LREKLQKPLHSLAILDDVKAKLKKYFFLLSFVRARKQLVGLATIQ